MKSITMSAYQLKINKIAKQCQQKPVWETLITMLEEAGKYRIINATKTIPKRGKVKNYHQEGIMSDKLHSICDKTK